MKKIILIILLLIFKMSFAQSGWQRVNIENPQEGSWIFDIKIYNSIGIMSSFNNKLLISSDGGLNWFHSVDSIKYTIFISKINNNVWIGSVDSVPYKSVNGGLHFYTTGNGITSPHNNYFNFVAGNSQKIFTGSSELEPGNKAYYSTNNGTQWLTIDTFANFSSRPDYHSIYVEDSTVIFGTGNFIYRSFNNGKTWEHVKDTTISQFHTSYVYQLAKAGNKLYATFPGVNFRTYMYYSTNYGTKWIAQNVLPPQMDFMSVNLQSYGDYVFCFDAWSTRKVYYCHYMDSVWKRVNTDSLYSLNLSAVAGDYLYVVGSNSNVYRKRISDVIGIQQISTTVPDKFYLSQNYPNPFNPVTNIKFSLPEKTFTKLKVYDLLGREVQQLINERLTAGEYKYDFNASLLPSGIYFYKLETDNFSETRKMVLVK